MATYTIVFLWGAVIFSDRRFEAAIRRQIHWLLTGGLIALLGFGLFTFLSPSHRPDQPGSSFGGEVLLAVLWSLFIWSWLHAVLYLGFRWLDFPHRALRYASQSVMAVYVIHHPIVLFVASFLVTWNLALWPKFALTLVVAASITFAVYEFGVRRWAVTRLLFGLGPVGAAPSDCPSEGLPMQLSA